MASRPCASKQLHVVAPVSLGGVLLPAYPLPWQNLAHNTVSDFFPMFPTLHWCRTANTISSTVMPTEVITCLVFREAWTSCFFPTTYAADIKAIQSVTQVRANMTMSTLPVAEGQGLSPKTKIQSNPATAPNSRMEMIMAASKAGTPNSKTYEYLRFIALRFAVQNQDHSLQGAAVQFDF